jgi:GntR family transcriptional regulator
MTIQRDSALPPWRQLAAILLGRIESGDIPPGARLPSISALAAEYDLALNTVRKALAELKAAGIIEIVPGWGSFARRNLAGLDLAFFGRQRGGVTLHNRRRHARRHHGVHSEHRHVVAAVITEQEPRTASLAAQHARCQATGKDTGETEPQRRLPLRWRRRHLNGRLEIETAGEPARHLSDPNLRHPCLSQQRHQARRRERTSQQPPSVVLMSRLAAPIRRRSLARHRVHLSVNTGAPNTGAE